MATRTDDKNYAAFARARFLRISPRKVRLVADLIRGMTVQEAFQQLAVTNRPSAVPVVTNLLKSAVSNVDRSEYSDTDHLLVKEIYVDGGPTLKRIQPRAMGRAFRIRKRSCHISIALGD